MDNRLLNEIQRSRKLMGISEGLNLPKSAKNANWIGNDRNLLTALDEYSFIARQPQKRSHSDEWFVIYKVSNNNFDSGWVRESELDNIMLGREWATPEAIQNVLGYVDEKNVASWMTNSFIQKFTDLTSYFGFANIMGESYGSFTLKDAIDKLNEFSGQDPIEAEDDQ